MFAELVEQRLSAAETRVDVDHGGGLARRESDQRHIALAPAVVDVVVTAESDDRRPPHRRLFAGRILQQLDKRLGIRASGFVGEQIDEPVHA